MAQPARASPDLFGDDSEDDLWLNDVFEGENDPEVLQQVTSAVAEFQARDRPVPVQEVQPDEGIRSRANNKFQMSSSPDVLEILAFVAWNQPVAKETMETIDRPNAMSLLRQLLRLQLVELQRTGGRRTDVSYVTTSKFLKLFGLRSISELPTADIFSFK